jgi:hypothetical protein
MDVVASGTGQEPVSSFLMQPPPPDQSFDDGDLFGALIHRKVHPNSELYLSMDMCLTIPFLDEPRDIFVDGDSTFDRKYNEPRTENTLFSDFHQEICGIEPNICMVPRSSEGENDRSEVREQSVSPAVTQQHRQYLTLASKEEFFKALHNSQYIDGTKPGLLWPESMCSMLCLRSIAGVDSAIFDIKRGRPANIFVVGYSPDSVKSLLNDFFEVYTIRKILSKVATSLSQPYITKGALKSSVNDPASLALGGALDDIMQLCDTSITQLEAHLLSSASACSLTAIAKATLAPKAVLRHIFYLIAPTDLRSYPQIRQYWENIENSQCILNPELIDFYLNVYKWKQPLSEASNETYPTAWNLLSHLLNKLSSTQMFHSATLDNVEARTLYQPILLRGDESLLSCLSTKRVTDVPNVSLDYIRVCVASFLVRRVSLPLMDQVERILFRLHCDDPFVNYIGHLPQQTSDIGIFPFAGRGDLSVSPLPIIQEAISWATTRLSQAKQQGPNFGALLKSYAAYELEEEDAQQTVKLVLPLHPVDAASNSKKCDLSMMKVDTMVKEVRILLLYVDLDSFILF